MEVEGIYTGKNAEDPEDVDDEYLPEGVSSEAAYILREVVEGEEIPDVARRLNADSSTVVKTLSDFKSRNLVSYPSMKRPEKDYEATKKGKKIIEIYKKAINSLEHPGNFVYSFSGVKREMKFGKGRLDAYEEFKFILEYIFNEKSISEIADENNCRSSDLLSVRDSFEPEIIEEVSSEGSKTVDYEITNTGLQALITLSEGSYFEEIDSFLNETDQEIVIGQELDFEEESDENSQEVDWSRLADN